MEFADYVREQRPALLRFATVLTGQPWLADDIVSDVLGRAFEQWNRIGGLERPHAYVRRMIVNEHLSWRRRRRHSTPVARVPDSVPPAADPDGEYVERDAMIARLARLPRRQRAVVVLRYYLGLSHEQIAAELGCRPGTVRSQLSRALAALRISFEDENRSTEPDLEAT